MCSVLLAIIDDIVTLRVSDSMCNIVLIYSHSTIRQQLVQVYQFPFEHCVKANNHWTQMVSMINLLMMAWCMLEHGLLPLVYVASATLFTGLIVTSTERIIATSS